MPFQRFIVMLTIDLVVARLVRAANYSNIVVIVTISLRLVLDLSIQMSCR